MRVGIISDIHGYPENFRKAVGLLKDCEMIFCAGDVLYHGPRNPILEGYNPKQLIEEIERISIPLLIARGNCDADVDLMVLKYPVISEHVFYEKNNVRFIILHGHNVDEDRLREIGDYYNADVVITGHTHIRKLEKHNRTIYINPGSISVPKGDGIQSLAVYDDGNIKFLDITTGKYIET